MSVHLPILVFAILLLAFPRNWLRHGARFSSKSSRRSSEDTAGPSVREPGERTVHPLAEAGKARNWIDFARGAVGGYALIAFALQAPEDTVGVHTVTLIWQGVVLALAALMQMARMEGRFSLFAPIFFLQGLTLGAAGWLVGLLAMVGSWALTPVLPGPGAVLFIHGAFTLILGLLLPGQAPALVMVLAGVVWLPVLLSVLLKKRLSASFDKRTKVVSRSSRERREAEVSVKGGRD